MKTKTHKKLKKVHHALTKKKVLKKHHAKHLARSFFTFTVIVSLSSLTLAIASTQPQVNIEVRTNLARALDEINKPPAEFPDQVGTASWYALGLPAPDDLTCASTKYPRGTYLLVKNMRNGKSVICRVNDYGPEAWTNRAIDLSRGSFRLIEGLGSGTTPVNIWVIPPPPSSFNLPFPTNITAFLGYNLCHQKFTVQFCEQNRRKPIKLK